MQTCTCPRCGPVRFPLGIEISFIIVISVLFAPLSYGLELFVLSWLWWEACLLVGRVTPHWYKKGTRSVSGYFLAERRLFVILISILSWTVARKSIGQNVLWFDSFVENIPKHKNLR
jgi:hypothetical protein